MSIREIVELVVIGVLVLVGIGAIVIAIVRGKLKDFIKEQMAIAEEKFKDLKKPEKSIRKLTFVLEAVKEKYKLAELVLNTRKFIEKIVDIYKDKR